MSDDRLRVMIVDDEAPARRRLHQLLEDCAEAFPLAIVGEAANGREALELLHAVAADLVLTDIHMPDMDGMSSRHPQAAASAGGDLHHRVPTCARRLRGQRGRLPSEARRCRGC
jgi:DNA-binding NtrC family response regulator